MTSRRVKRNRAIWAATILALLGLLIAHLVGAGTRHHHPAASPAGSSPLDADWDGDGHAVTFAFGGDVHFPGGTNLGDRLSSDPSSALGPTVPQLLGGVDISMLNLESALTDGTCPEPPSKTYTFHAPASALTSFRSAGVTLITNTNNHGEDCGAAGLQMALRDRSAANYPVIGIGQNEAQAFTPYRVTVHGQRIAIIAATQVIDSDLQTAWTATATQPGLASAYDVPALVAAVEAARRTADTVVVYLHWGTQLDTCPNPLQEPLARVLVQAGADIVVGTHAHVLLGAGYLGSAFVDYGLGNFAFYDNSPPENASGALVITATGRRLGAVTWRPAVIEDDLPQPLTGTAAASAVASWQKDRSCTNATAGPGASLASPATEKAPASAAMVSELSTDSG